jgi:REP-associated tyrosine transposase
LTHWRRYFLPGGTFFFTLVTEGRAPILTTSVGRSILRTVTRQCQQRWPFEILAIVLLPDHLHTAWRLPDGDSDYSKRWAWIKKEFTKAWLAAGGIEQPTSDSRRRNRRRGVLQRRFWEHAIRDEQDFERHVDYIHYNPVKHGYAPCALDWPWSSFRRHVRAGVYPQDWGCAEMTFDDIAPSVGE